MTLKQKQIIAYLIAILFLAGLFAFVYNFNSEISFLKNAVKKIENRIKVFAQIELPFYFMPRFPDRIIFLSSEMAIASKELDDLGKELKGLSKLCDCENLKSLCSFNRSGNCSAIGVFGDPCPNRKEIEQKQTEIRYKSSQISRIRELLEKEKEIFLEEESESLKEEGARTETANDLREEIEKLIRSSESIEAEAQNLINQIDQAQISTCFARCSQGINFSFEACLNPGEQKANIAKFEAGVTLQDLDLGEVKIKNINLNLPDKIQLSNLFQSNISIPLPSVTINFPEVEAGANIDLSQRPIVLQTPSISLPQPSLGLSCPNPPQLSSSYNWQGSARQDPLNWLSFEWYSKIFSSLSKDCQDLPGMIERIKEKRRVTEADLADLKKCFDPEKVASTINENCDDQWRRYCFNRYYPYHPQNRLSEICRPLRHSCPIKSINNIIDDTQNIKIAAADQCQNLFNQPKEKVPSSCKYGIREIYYYRNEYYYVSFSRDFDPIGTLENKCLQLQETGLATPPEPCKLLPLFKQKLQKEELPLPRDFERPPFQTTASPQTIGDFPKSIPGCQYNSSIVTVPKIILPDIIIPDVRMPEFDFCPFFKVKLPNFIFEDLILPDINLCDLDACAGLFPNLNFRLPYLDIPEISTSIPLPQINLAGSGKVILPDVEINAQFPIIYFSFSQLFNLGNLITPELELPSISLPQPKVFLNFSGVKIDFLNMLLGLVSSGFSIPSGCFSANFSSDCLVIGLSDWIFSWPKFPQIPEIPFCQDIKSFCSNILNPVTQKIAQIEDTINRTLQTGIQAELNRIAGKINEKLNLELQKYVEDIKIALEEHINDNLIIENGIIKIPPFTYGPKNINIPLNINLPTEITVNWQDLKKITLLNDISYSLPKIPLSNLSWQKDIEIKIPGFQLPSLNFNINLGRPADCKNLTPLGGNPLPVSSIEGYSNQINQTQNEIKSTSQKIIDILR